jgi:hypothetical protein
VKKLRGKIMSENISFQQVEQQVVQLPVQAQLKLVVSIAERLSAMPFTTPMAKIEEQIRQARLAEVDAWLAECDAVAESIEGEFDAAEDLRQIREERANQL